MMLAMGGLVVLAGAAFWSRQDDVATLEMARKEGIYWSSAQVELEVARFVAALSQFSIHEGGISAGDVTDRFDLLWSRAEVFTQGEIGARLLVYDKESHVIDRLRALMRHHEQAVLAVNDASPDVIRRIVIDFNDMRDDLRALSTRVVTGEETRLAQVRDAVHASSRRSAVVTVTALGLAILLVGIMLAETRRYRAQALASAELARQADAAYRVKARFLTMMSHELRTPMNGVLGTLALMRQSQLSEPLTRLVAQADRAGRQMHELLGDIFDLTDLQAQTMVVNEGPIELAAMFDRLQAQVTALQPQVRLALARAPGTPEWVKGDGPRLHQALRHVLTYLVETIRSRDIVLGLAHGPSGLVIDLDTTVPGKDQPGWQPEAMLGTGGVGYDDFASDALGPMIARGLIARMGGTVEILRLVRNRATVRITLPAPAADPHPIYARVEAGAMTIEVMARSMLKRLAWPVWHDGIDQRQVSLVLVEAGQHDESTAVLRMRRLHPGARVIALGAPTMRPLFDGVCALPLSIEGMSLAIGGRGALADLPSPQPAPQIDAAAPSRTAAL